MDEAKRAHILDDLKGIIKGDLLFDPLSRALYSTDASIFQIAPLGVVAPCHEEDLQALVRYAAENGVPLVPRGAGSGMAGESLGAGIIVDLSRHFRSILKVDGDTVRVQPGVVYRELDRRLGLEGRRFAPDPASGEQCTIGGMLATNASGARALRHGYTRDHVAELRLLFDTGETAEVGRIPRRQFGTPLGRLRDVVTGVIPLLERNAELIRACQPRTRFNRCGYLLHDVLTADELDLSRLLIGSEGTLAFFTEATLRTIPIPAGRSLVLLGFANLDAALRAAMQVLPSRPAACELIDHRLLMLARESAARAMELVPAGAEVILIVEYESDVTEGAAASAAELVDQLYQSDRIATHAVCANDAETIERLWGLRETALPSLYGLRGHAQPLAFIEDVGVPVEELPHYLRRVQEILQQHETTASFLIHAGTGQVHARPFLNVGNPADKAKLWAIAEQVHSLALDLNGTVSTQHGTGLARTPWVARQYGRLYPVLRDLKAIFDPRNLLNPGKIIGADPETPAWPLRASVLTVAEIPDSVNGVQRQPLPVTQLRWKDDELTDEIARCNGCGECRTESPPQRMCPIFRATHTEAATPRAKANLLRHVLQDTNDARLLSSDAVRDVADLCVNCKMCALECPAHVDIPKLMLEAKAANVAEHGLSRADWVMARLESFAAFGSAFAVVMNPALGSGVARWLMEKFFHVARKRRLPAFARRSFLKRAAKRGLTKPPAADRPRVAYFVDVFANFNDPQIGEAVVAVLRHNGIDVYVPPGQVGCGAAPLARGDVDAAREAAETNLRVLADLAREGYPIVCSEPTAALMLRTECRDLLDTPDTRIVAENVVELTAYLEALHRQGRLRTDFQTLDLQVGHHVPCHIKALGGAPAGPRLLALIPGLHADTIDVSCSGMAGTFGLQAENYEVSLAAGQPMLAQLAAPHLRYGSSECSSCRIQMEGGSGKPALHPVQYLALAYGLMPEIARRLETPIRGLRLR